MKRVMSLAVLVVMLSVCMAWAGDVGPDFNLHVGDHPRIGPAGLPRPPVVIEGPPVFLLPPALGFYVATGVPYDLFFVSNNYYLYKEGVWYRAPHYRGPWGVVHYKHVPYGLRKHKIPVIHEYRDREYRIYEGEGGHYHGRPYRPDHDWREYREERRDRWKDHRKSEHDRWKDEKKWDKMERKHDKHHGRDD